jgi:hypothetical protein
LTSLVSRENGTSFLIEGAEGAEIARRRQYGAQIRRLRPAGPLAAIATVSGKNKYVSNNNQQFASLFATASSKSSKILCLKASNRCAPLGARRVLLRQAPCWSLDEGACLRPL